MEEESNNEKEEKQFKFIDEINELEIDQTLSSYELATNISLFPTVLGIGGGSLAILGGAGIYGLASLASYFGFGGLATSATAFGIGTGGIGFALVGIGIGFAFLVNHLDGKKHEKQLDKEGMKSFEDKLNDPKSMEREFYNIFIENLNNHLNQKLITLIKNEYDKLLNVAEEIVLDSQEVINQVAKKLVKRVKESIF